MPAIEWLSSRGSGKSHNVQVSPEFESWNAAITAGIPLLQWLEMDPVLRSMVLGFYRARELHQAVMDSIRNSAD